MIVTAPHGTRAVAAAYAPLMFPGGPHIADPGQIHADRRHVRFWHAIRTPLLVAAYATAVIVALEHWILGVNVPSTLVLLARIAAGTAAYLTPTQVLAPQYVREARELLLSGFARPSW